MNETRLWLVTIGAALLALAACISVVWLVAPWDLGTRVAIGTSGGVVAGAVIALWGNAAVDRARKRLEGRAAVGGVPPSEPGGQQMIVFGNTLAIKVDGNLHLDNSPISIALQLPPVKPETATATKIEQPKGLEEKLGAQNKIRTVTGEDIIRAFKEEQKKADRWFFRGSTATYVRDVVLPDCIKRARRTGKGFRVRLEILDPSSAACESYVRLYQDLAESPSSPVMSWTVEATRIGVYATILAVCWHTQEYEHFTAEIGLSATVSTLRWEATDNLFLWTSRGPEFPAMLVARHEPFYEILLSEMDASFRQAHRVPLELASEVRLSGNPTTGEVRALFSKIGVDLPSDFTEKDILEIITKALDGSNPYPSRNSSS
jgi:hypothetical protein